VEAYNATVGSIEHSVFPQARKFERLGAAGAKALAEVEQVDVIPRTLAAADWSDAPPM